MKISAPARGEIETWEGFYPYIYDDKLYPTREWRGEHIRGTLTIGFGHTEAARYKLKFVQSVRISRVEADEILSVDLGEVEDQVSATVKCQLSQAQFDALASFTFNCGVGNLQKLAKPLVQDENYGACRAGFTKFVFSKGEYMPGLASRRIAEIAMWDGKYGPSIEFQVSRSDISDLAAVQEALKNAQF
jgi:GH24 family phage-related lysozyme (muramidase)